MDNILATAQRLYIRAAHNEDSMIAQDPTIDCRDAPTPVRCELIRAIAINNGVLTYLDTDNAELYLFGYYRDIEFAYSLYTSVIEEMATYAPTVQAPQAQKSKMRLSVKMEARHTFEDEYIADAIHALTEAADEAKLTDTTAGYGGALVSKNERIRERFAQWAIERSRD
ncbi:MAG TPA: hypothetical protein VLG09_02625 [Candidatus Saccharimonadales bacterium]|nr:hypothetical protein [Candidatus Saccharimonadales bacterium]